ncbi:uncharacterized protein LOC134436826 [Engraulis encrasicolus]|uniref:uncharacterized protein LOC134436826 n=1 Tax=Engraulis encrasicolus TaxID=184585 RepID=UPI002FD04983
MGLDSQTPSPPTGDLKVQQVHTYLRLEPKLLGAIQLLIGVLTLCLSSNLLQIRELHFRTDIVILLLISLEIIVSGSILIVTGLKPTLLWLKSMLGVHLVSLAFTTAALGLLSKNLPFRQLSYHCEHCRRFEIFSVVSSDDTVDRGTRIAVTRIEFYNAEFRGSQVLIDGILGTLVLFLIVEFVICIVCILFGLSVLGELDIQLPGVPQILTTPPAQAQPVTATPTQTPQVSVVVTEPTPEAVPTPSPEPVPEPVRPVVLPQLIQEVPPPQPAEVTTPQIIPVEPQEVVAVEPQVVPLEPPRPAASMVPRVVSMEPQVVSMEPQVVPLELNMSLEPQVVPLEPQAASMEPQVMPLEFEPQVEPL